MINFLPVLQLPDLIGVEVGISPVQIKEGAVAIHLGKSVCIQYQSNKFGIRLQEEESYNDTFPIKQFS